jgi:hypothetical protein
MAKVIGFSEAEADLFDRFIDDVLNRLASLESRTGYLPTDSHGDENRAIAVPVAKIDEATGTLDARVPGYGDADFMIYWPDNTTKRFKKQGAGRAKQRVYNFHRGMWLWDGVAVPVYRDFASGIWIADNIGTCPTVRATANLAIVAGGTGAVSVYRDASIYATIPGVKHDWMDGGEAVDVGTEVLVQWFEEDQCWRIINAECAP